MTTKIKLKIKHIDYHRNGICGIGFHVVLFTFKDEQGKKRNMVATVFPESGACSVLDVDMLSDNNIQFANGNSWRGDHFEDELREAIKEHDANA